MPKQPMRDMVILLPGITGSVLQKNGQDVWAPSAQVVFGALSSLGRVLQDLRLTDDDPSVADLGDGVEASRLVPDVHLVPGLVKIDGYSETLRVISDNFDVTEGAIDDERPANLFGFPYDWRRDNRASAARLKEFVDRRLPAWRRSSGAADARVILIGHSMGGLVSRYYLEVLEGWRDCRALITFGTPYRGSPNAVDYLANGYKKLFLDLTDVMRSFTAAYQLLPIYKMVQVGGVYQRVGETDGLPGIDHQRAADALAFHREIEAAVTAHRKDDDYLENGYQILPIVGTRQPTVQSAQFVDGRLTVSNDLPGGIDARLGDGDGTVPMLSAVPIELSDAYRDTFFPERHGSLQRNAQILDDLRVRLEQMQVVGLEDVREIGGLVGARASRAAAAQPGIAFDLDDVYVAQEPIQMTASVVNAVTPMAGLEALIESVAGATPPVTVAFQPKGDGWALTLDALPPGTYRAEVRAKDASGGAPPPVHDIFQVM